MEGDSSERITISLHLREVDGSFGQFSKRLQPIGGGVPAEQDIGQPCPSCAIKINMNQEIELVYIGKGEYLVAYDFHTRKTVVIQQGPKTSTNLAFNLWCHRACWVRWITVLWFILIKQSIYIGLDDALGGDAPEC